jgi:hypothetical protein
MRRSREERVDTFFDAAISGTTTSVSQRTLSASIKAASRKAFFAALEDCRKSAASASSAIIFALHAASKPA